PSDHRSPSQSHHRLPSLALGLRIIMTFSYAPHNLTSVTPGLSTAGPARGRSSRPPWYTGVPPLPIRRVSQSWRSPIWSCVAKTRTVPGGGGGGVPGGRGWGGLGFFPGRRLAIHPH